MVIVVTEKHQKQLFYSSKTPFLVVEFSNTFTFWKNARFDVILTGFPSHIALLCVTCWRRSTKTLKQFIIDTSYNIGSSDVITNVNTMTTINSFVLRKETADTWLFKTKL